MKVLLNHIREVKDVNNNLANSKAAKAAERNLQHGAAIDFDQRFGTVVGKRAETSAETGGKNHRLHWRVALASHARINSIAPVPDDALRLSIRPFHAGAWLAAPRGRRSDAGRRCNRMKPSDV